MKKYIILLSVAVICAGGITAYSMSSSECSATCTGAKSCSACKNCKYCKHCAKDGGTCGVCK